MQPGCKIRICIDLYRVFLYVAAVDFAYFLIFYFFSRNTYTIEKVMYFLWKNITFKNMRNL